MSSRRPSSRASLYLWSLPWGLAAFGLLNDLPIGERLLISVGVFAAPTVLLVVYVVFLVTARVLMLRLRGAPAPPKLWRVVLASARRAIFGPPAMGPRPAAFGRRRSHVPDVVQEALPRFVSLAAEGASEQLRSDMTAPSNLFSFENAPYLVAMASALATGLFVESFGGTVSADVDRALFLPDVLALAPVSPVHLDPEYLADVLSRVTGGPKRFAWDNSPADFHLQDLSALVVIAGTGARRLSFNEMAIERKFAEYIDWFERRYRVKRKGLR